MTPEEKAELAKLIVWHDKHEANRPANYPDHVAYGHNLTTTRRIVELLRKQVSELTAVVKRLRAKLKGTDDG